MQEGARRTEMRATVELDKVGDDKNQKLRVTSFAR